MATLKRRYYAWLIKAYFKRMRRTIIGSVIIGILVFFAFVGLLNYYFRPLIMNTTENIGYAGTYTVQTLPQDILDKVSYGLTTVGDDGTIGKGAAESWKVEGEKRYTFKLKKGIMFHNGEELTSSNMNFNFAEVSAKPIDKYTIEYTLKNPYSPFLVSVSRPIFGRNLEGIGEYKVDDIDVNGGVVRTITLVNSNDPNDKKKIYFYPTQKALKVAFMLGEVSRIYGAISPQEGKTDLTMWKKVKVEGYTNYRGLVSIFYNSNDPVLNDKKVRQALNYALPDEVENGERAYGPIPPNSIYYSQPPTFRISDLELSKTLLAGNEAPSKNPLTISTTEEYKSVALSVQKAWEKIGIKSKLKIVQSVPTDFQIFIYEVKLPRDPDQYVLWHSGQFTNITHYKNLRIDKLLEDGRSISNVEERKKIYADFQKYLTDDVPASFYYFPREYNIHKID